MRHNYTSHVVWTGNRGKGTAHYRSCDRTWDIEIPGKPVLHCSNDSLLGGDSAKMNPEDLLISALSVCHMLWYLHYASDHGIVLTRYEDSPIGLGEVEQSGAGRFVSAMLRPKATACSHADLQVAEALHHRIHKVCFIARSMNFPVSREPEFIVEE